MGPHVESCEGHDDGLDNDGLDNDGLDTSVVQLISDNGILQVMRMGS